MLSLSVRPQAAQNDSSNVLTRNKRTFILGGGIFGAVLLVVVIIIVSVSMNSPPSVTSLTHPSNLVAGSSAVPKTVLSNAHSNLGKLQYLVKLAKENKMVAGVIVVVACLIITCAIVLPLVLTGQPLGNSLGDHESSNEALNEEETQPITMIAVLSLVGLVIVVGVSFGAYKLHQKHQVEVALREQKERDRLAAAAEAQRLAKDQAAAVAQRLASEAAKLASDQAAKDEAARKKAEADKLQAEEDRLKAEEDKLKAEEDKKRAAQEAAEKQKQQQLEAEQQEKKKLESARDRIVAVTEVEILMMKNPDKVKHCVYLINCKSLPSEPSLTLSGVLARVQGKAYTKKELSGTLTKTMLSSIENHLEKCHPDQLVEIAKELSSTPVKPIHNINPEYIK